MAGSLCENELSCTFFNALPSEEDKNSNRIARQATEEGRVIEKNKKWPGSLNLPCGMCTQRKMIEAVLSQREADPIPH